MDAAMSAARKKSKTGRYMIEISSRARALLDREVGRLQKQHGGNPSGSKIADRIIIETLERKDG
jgi:hypothetical protein